MKAFARFLCVLSLTAFCVACGGGGGGAAPAPTPAPPSVIDASPGGIWTGIDSDGDLIAAFVTETGRFHVIDEFLNQGTGILSVSNGNDVTANFQLVTPFGITFPDGTTLADCMLSGTVSERQIMSVTVDCTTTAGLQDQITVTLDYVPLYERDSSLATIAGTYDDGSGIVTDIASDGMIFEQDPVSGCVTNGQVSVIGNGAFNLYDVEFGFSNCTGPSAASFEGASFEGLGDLLGGDFSSRAFGVSANGRVVVGDSTSASGLEGFRWTSGGGMVSLALAGVGVSADGAVIVGVSAAQAFRWQDGVMTGLGFLPGDGTSQAWDVSADGLTIVGSSTGSDTVPVYWDNGVITGLPGTGIAFGVSASGAVIVGAVNTPSSEAFRWENGVMTNLGFLPGRIFSGAKGVSADGSVVVGSSAGGTAGEEAFRWENGVMVSLGSLDCPLCIPQGQISSEAHAVSADGSFVVGSSFGEPFIWDAANGMRRLEEVLINEFGLDLSGWTFCCFDFPTISADGLTIVGTARNPNGDTEAWIAKFANFNGTSFVGIGTLDNTVTPAPEELIVFATGDVAGTLVSLVIVEERLSPPPPGPVVQYVNDFSSSVGPASLFGNAVLDSGSVRLTDSINNQLGSLVIDDLVPGGAVASFAARFDLQIGPGTVPPSDGISFNLGPLPNSPFGEEGAGGGLTISFDTFDNLFPDHIGIDVLVDGMVVATNPTNPFTNGRFVPVSVGFDADGTLDLTFDGSPIFVDLLTGFAPQSSDRFGFGGRTGGGNEVNRIDNVRISVLPR